LAGAPPQTLLGELTALLQAPGWIWGVASWQGRGWAGEEEGKGRGRGGRGKWRGEKGRAPKFLLNQGPSEPCYATVSDS